MAKTKLQQRKERLAKNIEKYEKLYAETGDTKYQDLAIKNRREYIKLTGGNLQSNNLYTTSHTVYVNSTGNGLTGQH